MTRHVLAVLMTGDKVDAYVSISVNIPYMDSYVCSMGVKYVRTNETTQGGWRVYRRAE